MALTGGFTGQLAPPSRADGPIRGLAAAVQRIRSRVTGGNQGRLKVLSAAGTTLATGGAAGAEPLATTRVVDPVIARPRYALRFLPAGDYTLALTCNGN